jgi:hypothetical protein
VLDAGALLPDDMPEVLDADTLLPDDDDNDTRWHSAVMAPFRLIFFVFPKGYRRCAATTLVSYFVVIRGMLQ